MVFGVCIVLSGVWSLLWVWRFVDGIVFCLCAFVLLWCLVFFFEVGRACCVMSCLVGSVMFIRYMGDTKLNSMSFASSSLNASLVVLFFTSSIPKK